MVGVSLAKLKQMPYMRVSSAEDEKPFLENNSSYEHENSPPSSSTHLGLDAATYLPTKRATLLRFFAQCWKTCCSPPFLSTICLINLCFIFINVYWHAESQNWIKSMKHWCPDTPACKQVLNFARDALQSPYGLITFQAPIITGIRYEKKLLDYPDEHDPYVGEYGQELTDAWFNLKKSKTIYTEFNKNNTDCLCSYLEAFFRATKEEMIQWGEYGDDSVPLSNGGYMAGFRVYHELHCLVGGNIH
jgi:hypothetical protein